LMGEETKILLIALICLIIGVILIKINTTITSALVLLFGFFSGALYSYAKYKETKTHE